MNDRRVLAVLAVLVLVRGALAFAPSMWPWGLNLHRFLAPLGWLPWLVALILLVPGAAAAARRPLERIARWAADAHAGRWAFALAAAGCVWSFPDRTWFTGDFILRQSAAEAGSFPGNFAQSLPLERLLNQTLPAAFGATAGLDPNLGNRLLGAAAAALLAAGALALARAWGLSGVAAFAAATIVTFGGWLTAFTGLGKPAAVLCALTVLAAAGAARLARGAGGGALLGGAVALALVTHRAALALLPLWAFAIVAAARARPAGARVGPGVALAAALPLAAAAIMAPLVWRIVAAFDLPRHLAPAGGGSALAYAFAPLHLADLLNLALLYVPALPVLAVLGAGAPRDGGRDPDATGAWILVLSFVPILLFIRPIQGVFRDLEVFATAGVALAVLTAHALGTALQGGRLTARVVPLLLAFTVGASVQWLAHFHDPIEGLRRARAFGLEAPARPDAELAQLWDVIAYRGFRLRVWDAAAEASERSVHYAPHPRARVMLAIARTYAGDVAGAHAVYLDLTRDLPGDPVNWLGLAGTAQRLGDRLALARARAVLDGYGSGGEEAARIRAHLEVFPEVWPERARALGLETNAP